MPGPGQTTPIKRQKVAVHSVVAKWPFIRITLISRISRKSALLHKAWILSLGAYVCPRYQVHYDEGFDNTIIVDGIPIIDKSKEERLLTKIAKEFTKKGVPIKSDDIYLPWDNQSGKSKGYAYTSLSQL